MCLLSLRESEIRKTESFRVVATTSILSWNFTLRFFVRYISSYLLM